MLPVRIAGAAYSGGGCGVCVMLRGIAVPWFFAGCEGLFLFLVQL
jgi:hypothetical protein